MNPYLSCAVLACFEGENQGGQPASQPNGDPTPPADSGRTFTQAELNEVLAKDRRKHQAQFQKMADNLEALSASKNLTEEERAQTAAQLEEVRNAMLTKEQQLQREKKQFEEAHAKKLKAKEDEAKRWESLYRDSTIDGALKDAAVKHDAFRPEQIITQLKPWTRMVEVVDEKSGKPTGKYKPIVDLPDQDENGQAIVTPSSPDAAVRRMKSMSDVYGNLFKSGVASGIGGNSNAQVGANGKVDPRKLSMEQYLSIREKNPELLGLRRPKGNGRRL